MKILMFKEKIFIAACLVLIGLMCQFHAGAKVAVLIDAEKDAQKIADAFEMREEPHHSGLFLCFYLFDWADNSSFVGQFLLLNTSRIAVSSFVDLAQEFNHSPPYFLS